MAFAVAACGSDDNSGRLEQHVVGEHVGSRARASRARASRPSRSAPRTSPRSSSSASSTSGALEAKGYTVNLKKNIGATEIIDTALTSHKIDAYPEYTGESVATVAKRNEPAKSADEEYQLAKQFYEGRGQTVSEPTPFEDVDAIAATKAFARRTT